ncbi:hypothetical protein ACF3M1_16835 [Luteimonas sp. WGS1318]|uniref:hypothetical protein n=1 Tax=Luteimonas sp. WGS1318 TaxID=3366815 RepID=UPI00372CF905
MNYVFLDTEWADEAATELVSLGMVTEIGGHEWYGEVDPLPSNPKKFAEEEVYSLLERGSAAHSLDELAMHAADFLMQIDSPAVLADHANDLRLLMNLLKGARWIALKKHGLITTKMLKDARMRGLTEAWFAQPTAIAHRRHHALNDARALRYSWQVVTNRIRASDLNRC